MTEENTQPAADATGESVEEATQLTAEEQLEKALEDVKHWKAMSRKNENAFKEMKPLAEKWSEYEKSQKPKEQQLEEELEALRKNIAEKETQALIATIGSKAGLPPELFEYISGRNAEEIEASVTKLKTVFATDSGENKTQPQAPNPLQGFVSEPPKEKESATAAALRKAIENL